MTRKDLGTEEDGFTAFQEIADEFKRPRRVFCTVSPASLVLTDGVLGSPALSSLDSTIALLLLLLVEFGEACLFFYYFYE